MLLVYIIVAYPGVLRIQLVFTLQAFPKKATVAWKAVTQ